MWAAATSEDPRELQRDCEWGDTAAKRPEARRDAIHHGGRRGARYKVISRRIGRTQRTNDREEQT